MEGRKDDRFVDEKDCPSDSHVWTLVSKGSRSKNGSSGEITMRCRKTKALRSPLTNKDLCSAMSLIRLRTPSRFEVSQVPLLGADRRQ
jgi:hypothetical protein